MSSRALLPLALAAIAGLLRPGGAFARDTASSARPPALEGRTGCELWVGKVSGNDPSVLVEALICEGINGAVTGQLQWSSLKSGYSIRDIAGEWKGRDRLTMHDSKMTVSKPNPGWVFCTVDAYELTRNGDQLNGTYTSHKCNDRATVALTKKAAPPVVMPPAPAEPEPQPPAPEAESDDAKDHPAAPSSCACRSSRAAGGDSASAALLVALAFVSWARRSRGRSRAAKPPACA